MFKIILFITILIAVALSDLNDKKWNAIFGEDLISNFEVKWKNATSAKNKTEILSKAGKIAFYIRLYRAWIFTPAGKKGFLDRFPAPKVILHPEIVEICGDNGDNSDNKLYKCIDTIYTSIQKRAEFLFPSHNQSMGDFNITEENFRRYISDSMFAYDVSVSYLMCFFTKNELSFLSNLPFCSYGFEKGQKNVWPSSIFRDIANNPLVLNLPNVHEPIDILEEDFICADESFCPDPCCGRTTNRATFCSHEICKEQDIRRKTLSKLQSTNSSSLPENQEQQHSCRVDNNRNNDFLGLTLNKWNVSCTFTKNLSKTDIGYIFRFDTLQCVDIQECDILDDDKCKGENQECINYVGGYKCVCLQGFYNDSNAKKCVPIVLKKSKWFGAAHAPALSSASGKEIGIYFYLLYFFV
uniref:EGF-like domain-containing protein n=1 Tax=Panagrolaimus davidi TaxID=227884 RepID=A0A914P8K8_9BILA